MNFFSVMIPIFCVVAITWILKTLYLILFTPFHEVKQPGEIQKDIEKGRFRNIYNGGRHAGPVPPVYPNGWFKVMDSFLLKEGNTCYMEILGNHLAIYRGEDGAVRILDAYCPHLGANLGLGGKVVGNCLECPFHGWQFNGETGKCERIPYAETIPNFAKTNVWQVKEINDMIFVWFDAEKRPPNWYPISIPEVEEKKWKFHGKSEKYVVCHIQETAENGSDSAHLNILHIPETPLGNWLLYKWKGVWEAGRDAEPHLAYVKVQEHLELLGHKLPFTAQESNITLIGPGMCYMHFNTLMGRLVIIATVTPKEPLLLRAEHVVFAEENVPRVFAKLVLKLMVRQFERDVAIWDSKTYLPNPLLVKEDGKILQFRRWYSQFYSPNSPTLQSINKQKNFFDW